MKLEAHDINVSIDEVIFDDVNWVDIFRTRDAITSFVLSETGK
jgi:hypothetical protein